MCFSFVRALVGQRPGPFGTGSGADIIRLFIAAKGNRPVGAVALYGVLCIRHGHYFEYLMNDRQFLYASPNIFWRIHQKCPGVHAQVIFNVIDWATIKIVALLWFPATYTGNRKGSTGY